MEAGSNLKSEGMSYTGRMRRWAGGLVRAYVVGDENVQGAHVRKEAHFVDGDDDGVEDFVLEGLEHDGLVADAELNGARPGAVLDDALAGALVPEHGHNVPVPPGAVAFDLRQERVVQERRQGRAQVLRRQDNRVLELLLHAAGTLNGGAAAHEHLPESTCACTAASQDTG